jgi:MSHA biogenesis protein MshN
MSILNNTLKSLDERNESNDFGLSPTVQLPKQRPTLRIALVLIIVILIVAAYSVFTDNSSDSADTVKSTSEKASQSAAVPNKANTADASTPGIESQTSSTVPTATPTSSTMEGITTRPLSSEDLALRNKGESVAEQALSDTEQAVDDEKPFRLAASSVEQQEEGTALTSLVAQNTASPASEPSALETNTADTSAANIASNDQSRAENTSTDNNEAVSSATQESIITRGPSTTVKPKSAEEQSEIHLAAGMKSYEFGMYQEAQKSLLLALTANAENHEARRQLAALYYGQGSITQALSILSDGVLLAPTNLEWRELMAKILVGENRFEEVLNIMPDNLDENALQESRSDYLILKGTSAQAVNKPRQAVSAFSAMTLLEPNNGKWWMALGINQDALDQAQQAATAYKRALSLGGLSSASAQYATARLQALQE